MIDPIVDYSMVLGDISDEAYSVDVDSDGKEFGITSDAKQALDVVEEALYDDHRLCVQGGGAKIAKSDASSPFFFHKSPRRRHRTGGEVAEKLQEP